MMVEFGRYALMGIITVFALALFCLIGFMVYSSLQEKKVKQTLKETPREDTLAEKIKNQFKVDDERKERFIHTKSGVSKTSVKQTRSAFAFKQDDAAKELSLESEFDNGLETPFISPEEKI
jgi:predicted RND superfamily exporter protein